MENEKVEKIRMAGDGNYGRVYTIRLGSSKRKVAMKLHLADKSTFGIFPIKELDILLACRGHPKIVFLESFSIAPPEGIEFSPIEKPDLHKFDPCYFVFEHASCDLYNYIHSPEHYNIDHLPFIIRDCLLSMEFIHSKDILHRDIKPQNYLCYWYNQKQVDQKLPPEVKITDFGLSKFYSENLPSTPKAIMEWYRSPECCRAEEYGFPSDMWAFGAVMYEIIKKEPLFDELKEEQVLEKCQTLLPPDLKERKNNLRKAIGKTILSGWAEAENYIDLMAKCLDVNPSKRPTATTALSHPLLRNQQEIISDCRRKFAPVPDEEPLVTVIPSARRSAVMDLAESIYTLEGVDWYKDRIMFHAIDIMDMYLCSKSAQERVIDEKDADAFEKDIIDIQAKFVTVFYMMIKYFTVLEVVPSISEIAEQSDDSNVLKMMEDFEYEILNICGYQLYRPTILEKSGHLSGETIDQLFNYMIRRDLRLNGVPLHRVVNRALDIENESEGEDEAGPAGPAEPDEEGEEEEEEDDDDEGEEGEDEDEESGIEDEEEDEEGETEQ